MAAVTTLTVLLPERTPLTIIPTHITFTVAYDSPWSTTRILREFFDIFMEGFFRSVLVLLL
ncbi:hypothetical protein K443DRAFT_552100 [Laccaria amethystina LaAM-08-1]|uniref:Uncharacterized protein n=1 Tax=Laccaria amethystina LaAM-08-1 TaxID=1095629 RepID=A0A0C9Y0Q5_9AGAR|nr:hypothetical protein K443DRAFT_552100 [Laccaria amethystina LaAM-08-1]